MTESTLDHLIPWLDCILVILPSMHSFTEILMQREYNIIKWIFFNHTNKVSNPTPKPKRKIKT